MNTVKSFWVGWGSLCIAGGGAYYFAKKSINADRKARFEAEQGRRTMAESMEYSNAVSSKSLPPSKGGFGNRNGGAARQDHSGSPSQEAILDPAPTRHAPESEGQRVREKSKYEASEPFKSKKGDRFS